VTRYKAVVFDLDGTLIDSAPDLLIAANRMLNDLRRPALTLENVAGFVGNGVPTLVARCLAATGGPAKDFDYAVSRFREHYARAPAQLTRPYVGVDMMLQRLTEFGFALGICTNKPYDFAVTILEKLRIMRFIGAVVGGDTSPKLKPDPAPLLLCLDRLGVSPLSTLYVGDSEIDAETAFRAKVPFALFSGGYLRVSIDAFEPLYVFDHFEDLSNYMLQSGAGR
jgi:phosphoglycolate phosphatase